MAAPIALQSGSARAELWPERGGLLARLTLEDSQAKPRDILWLPTDFSPQQSGWPGGGAPLLFPFAGRVYLGDAPFRYALDGAPLAMPLHGFAHAMPWQAEQVAAEEAVLKLHATAATRELFPFEFVLEARYTLSASKLTIKVRVAHLEQATTIGPSDVAMPLALGLHPYFRVEDPANTLLICHAASKYPVTPLGLAGKPSAYSDTSRAVPIVQEGLANLILGEAQRPWATLAAPGHAVRVAWEPEQSMRYVVLWSKDLGQFYCVEPWMALPNAVSSGECLWLPAGETYHTALAISLENESSDEG